MYSRSGCVPLCFQYNGSRTPYGRGVIFAAYFGTAYASVARLFPPVLRFRAGKFLWYEITTKWFSYAMHHRLPKSVFFNRVTEPIPGRDKWRTPPHTVALVLINLVE